MTSCFPKFLSTTCKITIRKNTQVNFTESDEVYKADWVSSFKKM